MLRSKSIAAMLLVLLLAASPVFCRSSFKDFSSTSVNTPSYGRSALDSQVFRLESNAGGLALVENPFKGVFSFYNQMIVGVVAGSLFALKFAIELLHAYMNEDSNPKGMKRCFLKLLLHVGVVAFGSVGVLALLGVVS